MLQFAGRTDEALEWAERAVVEAEAADDPEALGRCVFRDGLGVRRRSARKARERSIQRSLEAYQRAGNLGGRPPPVGSRRRVAVGRPLG